MKLRHLMVKHFRGVSTLDWFLEGDFLCLVGPGDSCKTTILDAIEFVLSPRWNPPFDDSDFHNGDASTPIVIQATVGDLPRKLLSDDRFGLKLRGYSATEPTIHDEPEDGDEEVVSIRLTVDSSLEPKWDVVADRHPEGVPISARDRERLGVTRLGSVLDRHLSWSKGSVLSSLTGEVDEHAQLLADAGRSARGAVDPSRLPKMSEVSERVGALASKLGVAPRLRFEPRIDAGGSLKSSVLSLHDGPVPTRRTGMGSRRLLTLAMQLDLCDERGIVLIDEVEHGLEPFRLRRLLAELLRRYTKPADEGAEAEPSGAGVLTTHSAVTLGELRAEHLRIVHVDHAGIVQVVKPSPGAQGSIVTHAEAFLSQKVIICEGATEMGLLRGGDEIWSESGPPLATRGVALAKAGGANRTGPLALDFKKLGYDTLVLADSDTPLGATSEELEAARVVLITWDGEVSTEQRLFLDLPWAAAAEAVRFAIADGYSVRDHLSSALGGSVAHLDQDPLNWTASIDEARLRAALGVAAKSNTAAWFKNVRSGARLGRLVAERLGEIPDADLARKLESVKRWAFDDES